MLLENMAGYWYHEVWANIFFSVLQRWELNGPTSTFLSDFFNDLRKYSFVSFWDVFNVLNIAVTFTLLRYILALVLFQPLGRCFQFIPKDLQKFPECGWKFLYYLSAFSYCTYTLFNGKYNFYENPESCWIGWRRGIPVPKDIYILLCAQGGFYIHSFFATLFMDKWRKDSIVMLIHHAVAVALIIFSYAVRKNNLFHQYKALLIPPFISVQFFSWTYRYHNMGVLVLFLHDISDIVLEFIKILSCMKMRGGTYHQVADIGVGIGFTVLSASWFYCRLYLFPHKVLHSTGHLGLAYIPTAPFYFFFNVLLWLLFLMNLWWFHFVVMLVWKIVSGQIKSIEDVRESETEEEDHSPEGVSDDENTSDNEEFQTGVAKEIEQTKLTRHYKNGYIVNGNIKADDVNDEKSQYQHGFTNGTVYTEEEKEISQTNGHLRSPNEEVSGEKTDAINTQYNKMSLRRRDK